MPMHPGTDNPTGLTTDMTLYSVGIVKNGIKEPFLKAGEEGLKMEGCLDEVAKRVDQIKHNISEIIVHEEFTGMLEGIDNYSHIIVLYWAHKVPASGRSLNRIHPMGRQELPLVGVFSTCSPARPNPVLMTVVRLCGRKRNVLTVAGLDAIDETPVIDIKPYVGQLFPQEEVVIADWMQRLLNEMAEESHPEADISGTHPGGQ